MINNNPAGERITFIFGRLVEAEDSFAILFTPPIIFQDEIYNLLALPPETTIESLITHSGKKLEKDKEYEFIPGEGSKVSTEFGALIFEGKSFEIKELAENESQVEASTSQQPKLSTKQSEPEQIVFTAERITGHSDTSNTLRIHFAEEIKYQTIKVKGLAILKILLRENWTEKVKILAEGERFEIAVKENSLKVCQDPGFYYLEATQGILEIKKLVNKGKSKETVNDEASNNRYTIVENKEEEIEEIANSSDDESILSYTEWTVKEEAKYEELQQEQKEIEEESTQIKKDLTQIEKEMAERKLSVAQFQEKNTAIGKRNNLLKKRLEELEKGYEELGIYSDSDEEEDEQDQKIAELREQTRQLCSQDLTYAEMAKKLGEIRAEFAKLGLNLELKLQKEGEDTYVAFGLSGLPAPEEEKAVVLASTSQTSETTLTQLFAQRLEQEITTVLDNTPPAVAGPTINAKDVRKKVEKEWKEFAKKHFSPVERWVGLGKCYFYRYTPGINTLHLALEDILGIESMKVEVQELYEGKVGDKQLVNFVVSEAQNREKQVVAHQKNLTSVLKKAHREYGDIIKAQKCALELKIEEVEDKEREMEGIKEDTKKKIDSYEKAGGQLQKELKTEKSTTKNLQEEKQVLTNNLTTAQQNLVNIEKTKNFFQTQKDQIEKEKNELQEKYNDLAREKGILEKERKILENTLTEKLAKITQLEQEITEYEEAIIRTRDNLRKNIGGSETEDFEKLKNKHKELKNDYTLVLGVIDGLDLKIAGLEREKTEKETELTGLVEHYEQLIKEKNSLETQNILLEKDLRAVKNNLKTMCENLEEAQEKITELQAEKLSLNTRIQELQNQKKEVEEKLLQVEIDRDSAFIGYQGRLDRLEITKNAEIRSKQTQLNQLNTLANQNAEEIRDLKSERDKFDRERGQFKDQSDILSVENNTLTQQNQTLNTELQEKTEELRNIKRQKRLGNLFAAGVFAADYLPIPGKWQETIKGGFNAAQAWQIVSDLPDATYEIIIGFTAVLVWYGVITIWYRIFGRKEINKIQELREELQEVRGKLTEAQIAAVIKDKNLLPKPKKAANKDKVPARKLIDEEKSSQSPEEPSEE